MLNTAYSRVVGLTLMLALGTVAAAVTNVVSSGETFVLNESHDGFANASANIVHAMAGSTLKVVAPTNAPAEGVTGFAAFHGLYFPEDKNWPAVGTSEEVALAAFRYTQCEGVTPRAERIHLYKTSVLDRQFDLYAAKWTITESMTISVFEHFAAEIMVILDGEVVLSDVRWNCESARRGITLDAGEHTLVIVTATQGQGKCTPKSGNGNYNSDGRYGHANAQNIPGLVYNVKNAELTLTNLAPGVSGVEGTKFFENTGDDAPFTTYVPASLQWNAECPFTAETRFLIDGGAVTLDLTEAVRPAEGFLLKGGVLATNGATLNVIGTDTLRFGGYEDGDKHWAFCGAPIAFYNDDQTENAHGVVAFENCATIISTPPAFTIADGTRIALMGPLVLGDGDVSITNCTMQLHRAGAVADGHTITVENGSTLRLKPCTFSSTDPWQWSGIPGTITNNVVLGGADARLELPNVEHLTVVGSVSGTGTIEAEFESRSAISPTTATTTFEESCLDFTGTVRALQGHIAFKSSTPGHPDNTVVVGETPYADAYSTGQRYGSVRLMPEGAGERETTASIHRVEGVGVVYGDNTEVTGNGRILMPNYQTLNIDSFAGAGGVWGDDIDGDVVSTVLRLGTLETNSFLRVLVRKEVAIGTMQTRAYARLHPNLAALSVGRMQGGSSVIVQGPTETTIADGAQGEIILTTAKADPVTVPMNIVALRRLTFESDLLTAVVTNGAIQSVCGTGTLVVSNGTVRLSSIDPTVRVKLVDGGRVVYAVAAVPGAYDLGADINPALWLDADGDPSTYRQLSLAGHPNVVYTNNSIVIDKWFDVRPEQRDVYGWNRRCDGTSETHQQVYPYLLANACNGRTTLQFDTYAHYAENEWSSTFAAGGNSRAGRRMPLNRPIKARYAIMVFGSENGGGSSVLGGWNVTENNIKYTTPGALQRFGNEYYTESALYASGSMRTMATDWSKPIFNTYRPTWVDGVAVDPTTTGFNGRYQILSFEIENGDGTGTNGVPVQCLGACGKMLNDCSGQIYGEVLIFTNALTDVQRQRVERYLSRKWGIPLADGALAQTSVDVFPGSSVELEDGGAGNVVFAGSPDLTVADHHVATGVHTGSVALAGGTLDIPALRLPWSEADVAATKNDQMGWYDPDDSTRFVNRSIPNDTRPLAVDTILSKFSGATSATYANTTAFLHGFLGQADYQTADANNKADRRPWRAVGARGVGPSRLWLDFTVYPENDGSGNCLRFKNVWKQTTELNNATRANQNFRTAFVVTDTSKGGGNVLCEASAGNMTPTKERTGYTASAPIWANGSQAAITNGHTYLDGVEINGRQQGYTGRPELLTVAATSDVLLSAVGYYNGKGPDGKKEHSYEIVGETIFYKTALDEETRSGVESYLMKKWLGKVPSAFVDWRDATVSGTGTVRAPSGAYLPGFDAAFAGTVELVGPDFAFDADASGVVTNAVTLPGQTDLVLPTSGALAVAFANCPKTCDLMTAKSVTGLDADQWTIAVSPETGKELRLKVIDQNGRQTLRLVVKGGPTIITVR